VAEKAPVGEFKGVPSRRTPFNWQAGAKTFFARRAGFFFAKSRLERMKAKIIITPKKAVLDPQGKTVQNALAQMGYSGVAGVHIGKYIEIDLVPGTDKAAARTAIDDAAHKLLSNPVIEDYTLEIE
jgi:phosphoribosylformylglycinamidine synthase